MIVSSFNLLIKTYRNCLFRSNFKRQIVSYQKKQTNYYQTNQIAFIRKGRATIRQIVNKNQIYSSYSKTSSKRNRLFTCSYRWSCHC